MILATVFLFTLLICGHYGAHLPAEPTTTIRGSLECLPTTPENGTCKEYYFSDTIYWFDWEEARQYCQSLIEFLGYEMDLVAIETSLENQVLKEFLDQNSGRYFWTAGYAPYDPTGVKDFVWVTTGDKVVFSDWAPGYPRTDPSKDVIEIPGDGTGWYDTESTSGRYPLCERLDIL